MRKRIILIFILAATALLALVSCSREIEPERQDQPKGPVKYCFTARLEQDSDISKAVMDDNAHTTWSVGDEIAVWDALSERFYTFENEGGEGDEACFVYSGEGTYEFSRAIYPTSLVTVDNNAQVTLPSSYTLADASSAQTVPMIGNVEDGDQICFKHLAGVLRLTVEGIPSSATTLEVSSSTVSLSGVFPLSGNSAGDGKIHASGQDATLSDDVVETKVGNLGAGLELQASEGSAKTSVNISSRTANSVRVYIPVPVGEYGYTISLKNGETELWSKSTTGLKEVKRATLYRMSAVGATLSGGNGTAENPYKISTADALRAFSLLHSSDATYRNKHYVLTKDIDMTGVEGFVPMGTNWDSRFTGVFDGNGKTIRGLSITGGASKSNIGFFGYNGGTIKNLTLSGLTVTATGSCVAAIAGMMGAGLIHNCRVDASCTVATTGNAVGSIVGLMRDGTVNACASHASISGGQNVGGIAGMLQPTGEAQKILIINCCFDPVYQEGKLAGAALSTSSATARMGGISGHVSHSVGEVKIVNCYAYPLSLSSSQSATTTITYVGGISGCLDSSNGTVFNCISPVTYSNILRSGVRVKATQFSSLSSASAIVGGVYKTGSTISRVFSSNAWNKSYAVTGSGASVINSNIVKRMGDGNMRGYSNTIVGSTTYTEAQGGIRKALDDGADEWNAANPTATQALHWEYDPTFGYPKPIGVDASGVVTKKVSIIGDSISTYEGYMFADETKQMSKFYPNTSKAGQFADMVLNEQQTWWWQLIYDKMSNARLEVNSAWGGTTVSYVKEQTEHMPAAPTASSQENSLQQRYKDYGLGNPDILFYFGGRNDFGYIGGNSNDLLGDYTDEALQAAYDAPTELYNNFSQGTVAILTDFHSKHPDAKIMIMMTDLMNDDYEDAAEAIRAFLAGKGFDIRFANLHKRGTTNTINNDIWVIKEEGSHPNALGCRNASNYIWNQLGSWLDN